MKSKMILFVGLTLSVATLLAWAPSYAQGKADLTEKEAAEIATEAYIYGYSLITTEVTRVQMTNVDKVEGLRGPMGQFVNVKRYPPADYRGVSAPNADTLYSVAWLDLGAEPIVFSHPDMGKRFYMFPMYSLWMPVIECVGSRTAGEKAANYLLTGPGWNGQVPTGMQQIKSPTRYLLILGRTYADGTEADYQAVNALQAQYKVVPLSAWEKPYTYKAPPVNPNPGFSMTDAPQDVILAMGTAGYFDMMAKLMGKFIRQEGKKLTILTATSGDTGSAVAHAFHNVPDIRVVVLFPFEEVSVSQRKLMTTLTGNIRTVAINGKFDDCQAMVKRYGVIGWPTFLVLTPDGTVLESIIGQSVSPVELEGMLKKHL